MGWSEVRADERITEWERDDGYVTVRVRRRPDETWAVRLDQLYQDSEERRYRRERADSEAAARELAEEWMAEFDDEA
ncbi:DUF7543 family protein [Halopelagius longus]|uniref:Uncharacterized protein n=1 Tax=Halopelagius longus TaxID=1236180 RepID=A0A1H1BQA5_9EURY|nr:hypothetical protein [Halopelagius longus]RDI70873.1 hypothetical protein DWB78_03545 [Halopelagius longus]SDQ54043.1 hypothetical protein SAMN05216278_1897 [Halopelagius longus]